MMLRFASREEMSGIASGVDLLAREVRAAGLEFDDDDAAHIRAAVMGRRGLLFNMTAAIEIEREKQITVGGGR